MAVTAGNGGLIPWQLGWATRFGRYQFVLGREIGVTFYGEQSDDTCSRRGDPPGVAADHRLQVDVLSTCRSSSTGRTAPSTRRRSSAVIVQLYAGIDDPHGERVMFPEGAPAVQFDRVYSLGVRIMFDWRRYF